jgi:tetrahydromethanopterin S-methyltransferase subunit F
MSDSDSGDRSKNLNQHVGYALGMVLAGVLVGFLTYLEGYQSEARC